jgi:hypothetical protein
MSKFVEFENRAPWSPGAISTLSDYSALLVQLDFHSLPYTECLDTQDNTFDRVTILRQAIPN